MTFKLPHNFLTGLFSVTLCAYAVAEEEQRFEISFSPEFIQGGDYEINHDGLIGVDLKYYLKNSESWRYFINTSYHQSIEREGSALDIFNLGVGSQYQFGSLWGKIVYTELSLGALYSQEQFSVTLIDREASSSFQDWDFVCSLGLGMKFSDNYSGKLYFKQLGSMGNSIGLSFSTSF